MRCLCLWFSFSATHLGLLQLGNFGFTIAKMFLPMDVPFGYWIEHVTIRPSYVMITSSNGNIVRVTGPLWGESTGHRWIHLTKASDAELWWFIWSAPIQTVEQTTETPMIWDAIVLIMPSL